jgi:hypothetical protein
VGPAFNQRSSGEVRGFEPAQHSGGATDAPRGAAGDQWDRVKHALPTRMRHRRLNCQGHPVIRRDSALPLLDGTRWRDLPTRSARWKQMATGFSRCLTRRHGCRCAQVCSVGFMPWSGLPRGARASSQSGSRAAGRSPAQHNHASRQAGADGLGNAKLRPGAARWDPSKVPIGGTHQLRRED